MDRDFAGVIRGCAENRGDGTWLVPEMIGAYERLYELGHAHSIEVWHGDELAGGLYGVGIGAFFSAESMFHRVTDASKAAVVSLVNRLREGGFQLLDIQFLTAHTARLGGLEIPRSEYIGRLAAALKARGRLRP
jgi:leucyl/phenylalanyl-tRNA--protein transferase